MKRMENRIILIEGIPGSGKTTTARRIAEEYRARGENVVLFTEGDLNPLDMAWQARLTETEYSELLLVWEEIRQKTGEPETAQELSDLIETQTMREDGCILLAYTKLQFPRGEYYERFGWLSEKEIFNGAMVPEKFMELYRRRWKRFADNADYGRLYVLECSYFQNIVFELLGYFQMSDEEISAFLSELYGYIEPLKPKIVYLNPVSIPTIIGRASAERKSNTPGRPDWIDEISKWVSETPYGKSRSFRGKGGVITFCRKRLKIDLMAIEKLRASGADIEVIERE